MTDTEKQRRLATAREHIFSTATIDAAADLCLANMTYGIAKIHYAQEHLGLAPDASFIGTPDMTITRNSGRWRAGIGYGGKLAWGDGSQDLLVLDVKPNTCGMLVGGLPERPDSLALTERLHDLHNEQLVLDGVPIKWDFGTGNHFVDAGALPPYVFVIHASGAELRGQTAHGPGLYWDDSATWDEQCDILETPWGPLRRREMAGKALFGDFETIANINHQGLTNPNEILLGCQSTSVPDTQLLPIMVRADRPAFLMKGLPNFDDAALDALGLRERADRLGLTQRLAGANIIPHGAGYSLPHLSRVRRVMEMNGTRYFELERLNQTDTQIISEPKDLTCGYRDEAVVHRTVECRMGTVAARLEPLFVLKT